MKTIQFKLPKIKDVEFEIECMPEDMPVKGNCSAIDEDTDREPENMIYEQLDSGNEWAWCCVKVTASYKGVTGTDYLGGCSYKSENDFKKDGYYKDMKQQAFNDLISQLEDLND
jgi:hypothetical protein